MQQISKRRWVIITFILLLGAFSRGLHITTHSFWIDEGFSFFFTQSPDLVKTLASDVHPPLYFAALRAWSELTGHSELALRWFSLLPSICSLAFVFQLAKEVMRARSSEWQGEAVPYLAMLMLALADVENYMSQEVRHYTWLTLLVLCSMLFLARWLRRSQRRDYIAWLVSATLMLYTHYIAAFALVAQGLFILFWLRGKSKLHALSAVFVSALAMAPWLIAVGSQQLENRNSYKVWSLDLTGEILHEIGVKYFTEQWVLIIGLLALGSVTLVYRCDSGIAWRFDRITPLSAALADRAIQPDDPGERISALFDTAPLDTVDAHHRSAGRLRVWQHPSADSSPLDRCTRRLRRHEV